MMQECARGHASFMISHRHLRRVHLTLLAGQWNKIIAAMLISAGGRWIRVSA